MLLPDWETAGYRQITVGSERRSQEQTGWQGPALGADSSWRSVVHDRVASLDWTAIERDVEPFLEPGPAVTLFTRENLLKLISG
jgi:hypothetical protein